MTNYVNEIAKIDKQERFNAIINALNANGIAYRIEPIDYPHALGNIVVEYNRGDTYKTVVSAHYDNVYGTPGANDHASACSILLNLIIENKDTARHLEFVLFDLEEKGCLGSQKYIRNNLNISYVINMDMCGLGENTVACKYNWDQPDVPDLKNLIIEHRVHLMKDLPTGDAYTFRYTGVPTLYIVNSTPNDIGWYLRYASTRSFAGNPDFLKTMHLPNDTPDTVNLDQIEKIHDFVNAVINS